MDCQRRNAVAIESVTSNGGNASRRPNRYWEYVVTETALLQAMAMMATTKTKKNPRWYRSRSVTIPTATIAAKGTRCCRNGNKNFYVLEKDNPKKEEEEEDEEE
jgi:hypothetical protein